MLKGLNDKNGLYLTNNIDYFYRNINPAISVRQYNFLVY